jgi:alcohol dehydrogenase class IV
MGRLTFGPGALDALPGLTAELSAALAADGGSGRGRPPLLLAGHTAAERPWLLRLRDRMPPHLFATVSGTYPTWATVDRFTELMIACECGPVIAVGGGSVMDTAKVAAARAAEVACAPRRPVVAVPTTPGTGAEATPFATVWDFSGARKHSYARHDLTPDAAVVDPDLIRTLPADQLGSCALDALAQGMEAVWSTEARPESAAHGLAAAGLAAGNLERLLADPDDVAARSAISLAGLYSGMAIAISRTTLCHALSYPLTLRYGVRHGHACALTLGAVLRYNAEVSEADCAHPRGADRVHASIRRVLAALRCRTPEQAAARISALLTAAGLSRYRDGDYDDKRIAEDALNYDRARNNPRRFDKDRLVALLAAVREESP